MTDTNALIAEWVKLTNQINRLTSRLEPVQKELLERLKVGDPVPIPKKVEKIVKRDRSQLDPDKLHEQVSEDVWELITERKPVAARIEVAIRDGALTQETVTACSTRTKPWLAITKK